MSSAVKALFQNRQNLRESEESARVDNSSSRGESTCSAVPDLLLSEAQQKHARQARRKPRYRIDLSAQMAECEANYHRLLKILSNFEGCNEWNYSVGRGAAHVDVCITVIDRAPYTTTLKLYQRSSAAKLELNTRSPSEGAKKIKNPTLTICLYHDAELAEVVAWEDHRRLRPRYAYPNPNMYHADEKAQFNRYLSDWLHVCQEQGRTSVDLRELGLPTNHVHPNFTK